MSIPKTYSKNPQTRSISFFMFNTDIYICLYLCDKTISAADVALQNVYEQCLYFEHHLSRTREDSDISLITKASPRPVNVCSELLDILEASIEYSQVSSGAFDITMGTVTSLWDFHNKVVPSSYKVHKMLEHVGIDHIHLDRSSTTVALDDPLCVLDLGGIAKGYIADKLSAYLQAEGFSNFILNLGGNVLVHGGRPSVMGDIQPFCIGVADPLNPKEHCAFISVHNASVVTSGIHERSFYQQGKFYHHILDARTGFPAQSDLVSTTIVSDKSIDGDAFATICFLVGKDAAMAMIEGSSNLEGILIDAASNVWVSSGIRNIVKY